MKRIITLGLAIIIMTTISLYASADSVEITTKNTVNVRAKPDKGSKKVGTVNGGEKYQYLDTTTNGWIHLQLSDGTDGYISGKMGKIVEGDTQDNTSESTRATETQLKPGVPKPSDESFETFSSADDQYSETISGIRFDLDDENMPVVIIKVSTTNVSKRSVPLTRNYTIIKENKENPGDGSELNYGGTHYRAFDEYDFIKEENYNSEIKPGQTIEREFCYQLDDFSERFSIYFLLNGGSEIRTYDPQDVNHPEIIPIN